MSFWKKITHYRWNEIEAVISRKTSQNVRQALRATSRNFDDLLALLSPAGAEFLEEMALAAHGLTVQRFGRTIRLYAPLYLSNYCINRCRYCGFNQDNAFTRTRLTIVENALHEVLILRLVLPGFDQYCLQAGAGCAQHIGFHVIPDHHDLPGLAVFLDAFGRVHAIPDGRVIHQVRHTSIANYHLARIQANPYPKY